MTKKKAPAPAKKKALTKKALTKKTPASAKKKALTKKALAKKKAPAPAKKKALAKKKKVQAKKAAPAKKKAPAYKPAAILDVLQTFTKALVELYKSDPTKPGVVLAWLPEESVFYCSAVRYERAMGGGKVVLASSKAASIEKAIANMAQDWYSGTSSSRKVRKFALGEGLDDEHGDFGFGGWCGQD